MINLITEWFKIILFVDKTVIIIEKLINNTWLTKYPSTIETTYYQGYKLLVPQLQNALIRQQYGIVDKPETSGNKKYNSIIEIFHEVLGNLIWACNMQDNYMDYYDP